MFRIDGISPPIEFKKMEEALPNGEALYIQALDEIFLPEILPAERQRLLSNLNEYLKTKSLSSNFQVFFNVGENCDPDKLLNNISQYLPEENEISSIFGDQIEEDSDKETFLIDCHGLGINTLEIGGVFGDACVWLAAVKMAKNIFAKNLGGSHPNIRFVEEAGGMQFENVIILPGLTEGMGEGIADSFACFKQLKSFSVPLTPGYFEDAENKLIKKVPTEIGANYINDYAPGKVKHTALLTKLKDSLQTSPPAVNSLSSSAVAEIKTSSIDKTKEAKAVSILTTMRGDMLTGRVSLKSIFHEQQSIAARERRSDNSTAISQKSKESTLEKARKQ